MKLLVSLFLSLSAWLSRMPLLLLVACCVCQFIEPGSHRPYKHQTEAPSVTGGPHDSVAPVTLVLGLRRFLWLTPRPAASPITAARRLKSAAISAKPLPFFTPPDVAGSQCVLRISVDPRRVAISHRVIAIALCNILLSRAVAQGVVRGSG